MSKETEACKKIRKILSEEKPKADELSKKKDGERAARQKLGQGYFTPGELAAMKAVCQTPGYHPYSLFSVWGRFSGDAPGQTILYTMQASFPAFRRIVVAYERLGYDPKQEFGFDCLVKIPVDLFLEDHKERWNLKNVRSLKQEELYDCWMQAALISSFYPNYFVEVDSVIRSRVNKATLKKIKGAVSDLGVLFPVLKGASSVELHTEEFPF